MPENMAPAGKYTLVAARWRKMLSEPGAKIAEWVDHYRGDEVELDAENATRLLKAGAVEPTTKAQSRAADLIVPSAATVATENAVAGAPSVPAPPVGESVPAPGQPSTST